LLFGIRGFFLSNLPLFCFLAGGVMLLRKPGGFKPEVLFAFGAAGGTWLLYAALSTNYSGHCRSIRWFVPLLAPAYVVIALFYQRFPSFRWTFWLLSGIGGVMGALMWYYGPWKAGMIPGFWVFLGLALIGWLTGLYYWRRGAFTPHRTP
jgi:hypothetical protein